MSDRTDDALGAPRVFGVLAYLLPGIGPLAALILCRHRLATLHAWQSLLLSLLAVAAFVVWVPAAWILNWLPIVGAIGGMMLFAFVPLAWLTLLGVHLAGAVLAFRGQDAFVPLFGAWLARFLSPEAD